MEGIGKRLKQIREEKKLSSPDLARQIETNKQNIYNWEDGINDPNDPNKKKIIVPSAENLIAICRAFGVNLHWLLTGEGEKYMIDLQNRIEKNNPDQNIILMKDAEIEQLKQEIVFLKSVINTLQTIKNPK